MIQYNLSIDQWYKLTEKSTKYCIKHHIDNTTLIEDIKCFLNHNFKATLKCEYMITTPSVIFNNQHNLTMFLLSI